MKMKDPAWVCFEPLISPMNEAHDKLEEAKNKNDFWKSWLFNENWYPLAKKTMDAKDIMRDPGAPRMQNLSHPRF